MKKLLWVAVAATGLALVACSKDEGPIDNPNTITLAKQWFIRVNDGTSTNDYRLFSTRTLIITEVTDTIFNIQQQRTKTDTLTLDDHNLQQPTFRTHVRITPSSRTFGTGTYRNWNDTTNAFILKEGRIIRNGGRSRTGRTVDSIFIRYAFQSAPNTDYVLSGHERTGLVPDEY